MMIKHQRAIAGFTLVELLVALTILAMMSMMSWRGLDSVLRARDAAITQRDKVARLANALEQMGADVRSATSGRAATPIVLGSTGFAMERELAQSNGPARRTTVQWQFSENTLVRTVVGETPQQTTVTPVLRNVGSWDLAVFVNGNWIPGADWLKEQEELLQQQTTQPPPPPRSDSANANAAAGNVNPVKGKIVALSIKLVMPEGEVTKILLTESL
jgi:prepilin-type N-terminal cleavage/methylation domain-containing protein